MFIIPSFSICQKVYVLQAINIYIPLSIFSLSPFQSPLFHTKYKRHSTTIIGGRHSFEGGRAANHLSGFCGNVWMYDDLLLMTSFRIVEPNNLVLISADRWERVKMHHKFCMWCQFMLTICVCAAALSAIFEFGTRGDKICELCLCLWEHNCIFFCYFFTHNCSSTIFVVFVEKKNSTSKLCSKNNIFFLGRVKL